MYMFPFVHTVGISYRHNTFHRQFSNITTASPQVDVYTRRRVYLVTRIVADISTQVRQDLHRTSQIAGSKTRQPEIEAFGLVLRLGFSTP